MAILAPYQLILNKENMQFRGLNKYLISALLFLLLVCFTSCSKVLLNIYGFSNPKFVTNIEMINIAYGIDSNHTYKQKKGFNLFLDTLEKQGFSIAQNYYFQPLKVFYYEFDSLKSIHVNCYAGGFPNLKWNKYNLFETFPPISQFKPDTLLPLSKHLNFIEDMDGNQPFLKNDVQYTVIVYWNYYTGRQAKRFIEIVNNNLKLVNEEINILYINNDNLFIDKN